MTSTPVPNKISKEILLPTNLSFQLHMVRGGMTITFLGRTHLKERKVAVAAAEVIDIDSSDGSDRSPKQQEQHGQNQQESEEIERPDPVSHWRHMLEQEANFPDLGWGKFNSNSKTSNST
jgi:hypothetical protein